MAIGHLGLSLFFAAVSLGGALAQERPSNGDYGVAEVTVPPPPPSIDPSPGFNVQSGAVPGGKKSPTYAPKAPDGEYVMPDVNTPGLYPPLPENDNLESSSPYRLAAPGADSGTMATGVAPQGAADSTPPPGSPPDRRSARSPASSSHSQSGGDVYPSMGANASGEPRPQNQRQNRVNVPNRLGWPAAGAAGQGVPLGNQIPQQPQYRPQYPAQGAYPGPAPRGYPSPPAAFYSPHQPPNARREWQLPFPPGFWPGGY